MKIMHRTKYQPVEISRSDLLAVLNPARYTGGEWGMIKKASVLEKITATGETSTVRFAFCFPDIYEIGMSNLALKILYEVLNSSPDIWCERVFSPWLDMDKLLREKQLPLFSLESSTALKDFDIVGFTLQYEMCYTNVLQMLDLGGIPLLSKDRGDEDPLVIAGGPVVYNIEPMADFFDLVVIGEGEAVILELTALYKQYKERRLKGSGFSKLDFLRAAAQIPGIYVPAFYQAEYHEDGRIKALNIIDSAASPRILKRIQMDLDQSTYPVNPVVPHSKIVHDRAYLELFRGCIHGCRFCQAGFLYRPVREKSAAVLCAQAFALENNTGYDEIGMLSLSTSDYRQLSTLTDQLLEPFASNHTSLSLPSLRVDSFSLDLMQKAAGTRKSGLTFAPEAGTQRLRDVVNKGIQEEDILNSLRLAFEGGWSSVKLYFMLGLPTETDEDVLGIAELARKIERLYFEVAKSGKGKRRKLELTVSTSMFIPKPFTPFQWAPQATPEVLAARQVLLRNHLRSRNIKYIWHDLDTSVWETVIARGDRRLGAVLLEGYRSGLYFDAWDDIFKMEPWAEILQRHGLSIEFYSVRERDEAEIFPWDHIDPGVKKDYLWQEYRLALKEQTTPSCRESCTNCGAAAFGGGVCYESRG